MMDPILKLVILDRDGVINHDSDDYIKNPDEWIPIDGSAEAIARLNASGYKVVVATNQSGIARGYYDLTTLTHIHLKMINYLAEYKASLDGIFFCPHGPDEGCDCRKPLPGLLDQVKAHLDLDSLDGALIVGDSLRDLEAGVARHCVPVLVKTGKGKQTLAKGLPEEMQGALVYDNLADFVDDLLLHDPEEIFF